MVNPAFRFSINFVGAPALSLPEFAKYRPDFVAGASLQVVAPLGQYDPSKLINLGTNIWTFRPDIGASKTIDALTLELAVGASVFTTNHDSSASPGSTAGAVGFSIKQRLGRPSRQPFFAGSGEQCPNRIRDAQCIWIPRRNAKQRTAVCTLSEARYSRNIEKRSMWRPSMERFAGQHYIVG